MSFTVKHVKDMMMLLENKMFLLDKNLQTPKGQLICRWEFLWRFPGNVNASFLAFMNVPPLIWLFLETLIPVSCFIIIHYVLFCCLFWCYYPSQMFNCLSLWCVFFFCFVFALSLACLLYFLISSAHICLFYELCFLSV